MYRLLGAVFGLASTCTAATVLQESQIRGAMMGSLVGDALSLATHYEYDAQKISKFYGEMNAYYAPGEKTGGTTHGVGWGNRNYHNGNGNGPAKRAGEQTDYGDYGLLILEHLANTASSPHPMDIEELVPLWRKKLKRWRSWICTQTKATLEQVRRKVPFDALGGNSNAMAIRAPAVLGYYDKEEEAVAAARVSMFTHKESTAHMGNEFFTRVAFRVIHNKLTPEEAILEVASESNTFVQKKVTQAIDKVAEASDSSTDLSKEEFVDDRALTSMARLWDVGKTEPIKVGKASPTEGTLPGSLYFILKYPNDLIGALKANAMVGGDNASRAMAIGMVLGAYLGVDAIPAEFAEGKLVEWSRAMGWLDQLPLLKSTSHKETADKAHSEL